jgi:hypothetical protein
LDPAQSHWIQSYFARPAAAIPADMRVAFFVFSQMTTADREQSERNFVEHSAMCGGGGGKTVTMKQNT